VAKKIVKIESKLTEGFKIEVNAGNHSLIIDQPKDSGGKDAGANPLEYFLAGLAGCMLTMGKMVAAKKRIKINEVRVEVAGELDLDGLMGINPNIRSGFQQITVKAHLDANISPEEKQKFLEEIERLCPAADSLFNSTKINLEIA
jgi:uncharacterized OsmC-like protein